MRANKDVCYKFDTKFKISVRGFNFKTFIDTCDVGLCRQNNHDSETLTSRKDFDVRKDHSFVDFCVQSTWRLERKNRKTMELSPVTPPTL